MTQNRLKLTVIAVAIASALTGAYSASHLADVGNAHAASQPAAATLAAPVSAPLPDMSSIVAANGPAVVNISVAGSRRTADSGELPQLDPDDPFYEFFRHFRGPQPGGKQPMRGQGSGFIVSPEGIILTNAHVVDGADEVTVKLTDRREFKAKVLGLDKASDVAVIRIDAKNLPVVKVGSATSTRVGEWVLAIGSPFGFENSASAGIVSAKSRALPDGSYVPFIQTDVAVNPGNSGGPLFNMAGEVIGINSQIFSRSGGYQGLSFAIPIELAMNVERQIVSHGKVQRGRLGVTIQEVNQSLADSFGLQRPAGALINSVDKNSPAARAGLEPGDVILSLNGREIGSSVELPAMVAALPPGETARLQVWRHGAPREIEVRVGKFESEKLASSESAPSTNGRLGVAARDLTAQEARQADIRSGVLVESVKGAAAKAGLRPGDIIVSINGEPVTGVEQLATLVAKSGKRAAVLVERGDSRLFVPVDLG
ncbi:MAG: DegQ family serine endoprotease [Azonexus sp.]